MENLNLNTETAFLDLIKPENLSKIKIDPMLVPPFCEVMEKMQEYFTKKGLTGANNYAKIFEQHILTPGKNQLEIRFEEIEGEHAGSYGTYDYVNNKITINKALNQNNKDTAATFAHEFIHFLTAFPAYAKMSDGSYVQIPRFKQDAFIKRSNFFNEAYTELLTRELYPDSTSYQSLIHLMDAYNYVTRSSSEYFAFLRGQMPGKTYDSVALENFQRCAETFMNQRKDDEDILQDYASPNYIKAQYFLISYFEELTLFEIENFGFLTVEDFVVRLNKFCRYFPPDIQFLNKTIQHLAEYFSEDYYGHESKQKQAEIAKQIVDLVMYEKYTQRDFLETIFYQTDNYILELNVYTNKVISKIMSKPNKLIEHFKQFDYEQMVSLPAVISDSDSEFKQKLNVQLTFYKAENSDEVRVFFEEFDNIPAKQLYDAFVKQMVASNFTKQGNLNFNLNHLYENKKSKLLKRKNLFENLEQSKNQNTLIINRITKDNKQVIAVLEVEGVDGLKPSEKLFLACTSDYELNFYYCCEDYVQSVYTTHDGRMQMSIDNKQTDFKVQVEGGNLLCTSKKGTLKNKHSFKPVFLASDYGISIRKSMTQYENKTSMKEFDF